MIFTSHIDESGLTIKAHPENEAEWSGHRFDGNYPAIRLVHTEVKFEHPLKSIHPDLLGMLCMLLFFPFCKNKITFPQPVSTAFEEAFTEIIPPHDKIDGVFQPSGKFEFTNVDKNLKKFSGTRLALSMGGGTDSMAAHVLFPEAILVHELSRDRQGRIIPDDTVKYLEEVRNRGGQALSIIQNGRRWISEPSGWTTWISSAATAVLIATDMDIGYIMRGTTSESMFLELGYGFRDLKFGEQIDPWFRVFNHIGLKHFTPVGSITEAATMKICHDAGLLDKTVSCQSGNGGECHKCFKCFRKNGLANALGYRSYDRSYWKGYKTEKLLTQLKKQPLIVGHIYKFSLSKLQHIKWLRGYVDHLPDPEPFLLKYYEPGITLLVPEEWQDETRRRISRYVEPLTDPKSLKEWKQTPYPVQKDKRRLFSLSRIFRM